MASLHCVPLSKRRAQEIRRLDSMIQAGIGARIVSCHLPTKSPWLNPIEPNWAHGKRRVAEPARLLPADELIERVCAAFDCPHHEHLAIPQQVA